MYAAQRPLDIAFHTTTPIGNLQSRLKTIHFGKPQICLPPGLASTDGLYKPLKAIYLVMATEQKVDHVMGTNLKFHVFIVNLRSIICILFSLVANVLQLGL